MATKASNANAELAIIKELVAGTTPTTPVLTKQRFSTFNPTFTKAALDDDSKTGSREKVAVNTGNNSVTGALTGNLCFDNFDTLLESLMFNEWDSSDELIVGSTPVPLTIERHHIDTDQYQVLRGGQVNTLNLSTNTENYTTVSFDLIARSLSGFTNTSVSASPYTEQTSFDAFFHCEGEVEEGGVTLAIMTALDITFTNNLSANYVYGNCDADDVTPGMIDISGTLSVNLVDNTLVNKFITGSYSSLKITLADAAGNTMSFYLPKIKYSGANAPIESGSGLITLQLPFTAVKDAVEGSGLVITRDAA